jgi:type II secretory pathway pseudopilin PulG
MAAATSFSPRRRGFGTLELLTALAFLVIVLGVMVSLARYVRATSAERITQQVLRQLDVCLRSYFARPLELPPGVEWPPPTADEAAWAAFAQQSEPVVRQLLNVDEPVTDAWGRPIGYLPNERAEIGMAPRDRPFCFSPGPDGRYLTQDDNLYSYDQLSPVPIAATPATTQASDGGHGE